MEYSRMVETDAPVVVLQAGITRLEDAEKLLIVATLKRARFNRTRAANMLGIGIRTLQRKIKQYATEAETSRMAAVAARNTSPEFHQAHAI
jgi:DNA-binding NtrC family response regulator